MTTEIEAEAGRPTPVMRQDRLASLDLIRGVAVLGILLANVVPFAQPDIALYWPPAMEGGDTAADRWIWLGQLVLVDGKFRGLFTVLFGAGMALFVDRLVARGADDAVMLQLRRLLWLGLFGIAHFFLLFEGDILFAYALAGLIAILAINLRPAALLLLGIGGSLLGGVLRLNAYWGGMWLELSQQRILASPEMADFYRDWWSERVAKAMTQADVWANGSWFDVIHLRWEAEAGTLPVYFIFNFHETIPLMLVGMGLYRAGLFAPGAVGKRLAGAAAIGVVVAGAIIAAAGLWVMSRDFPPFASQFVFFGVLQVVNVPMILGAVILLCVVAERSGDSWLGERLRGAGRTAFTNYILSSLLMSLLFQGWAGGLFGTLHRDGMLLAVLLGWAVMLTWPRWWLPRFRQGPLEWLWRSLTYWERLPNRR